MAHMEGLYFQADGRGKELHETRAGIPQFSGTAYLLPEWKFKVLRKRAALNTINNDELREEKLAELMSKIIDGLTDDALRVSMDLGESALSATDGIDTLVKAMEAMVGEFKEDEARELFHLGTKSEGAMTRQTGESMTSYITRRKRWFSRLKSIDNNTSVSENILVDYLMDGAGISYQEKLMIRTVCGNDKDFETIALALRKHHARIHLAEKRRITDNTGRGTKPFQPRKWSTPRHHTFVRRGQPPRKAFAATEEFGEEQEDDGQEDEQASEEPEGEDELYACVTCLQETEYTNVEDQIEQDVVTAFVCAGADLDDTEHCEQISSAVQNELFSFYSREEARQNGVPACKTIHNFRPKSELTIEERKKNVDKAKAGSSCRTCGEPGHWSGDPACKKKHLHKKKPFQKKSYGGNKTGRKDFKSKRAGFVAIHDHDHAEPAGSSSEIVLQTIEEEVIEFDIDDEEEPKSDIWTYRRLIIRRGRAVRSGT